jgi:phage tail sheath protein FI
MVQFDRGPNVYIEEVPSGVHTITGVATSIAAFVDFFPRGDLNIARRVQDFGEFTRVFGGLNPLSEASYGIQQFFGNGGTDAWVVRTASGPVAPASVVVLDGIGGAGTLRIDAINAGAWGNGLRITVDPVSATTFNLGVQLFETIKGELVVTLSEVWPGLTRTAGTQSVLSVVNDEFSGSKLIRVTALASTNLPQPVGTLSGPLPAAINLTSANPQLTVTIGAEGSGQALLRGWGANPGDIGRARAQLEAAIRAARPENQAFSQASVSIVGNRLRVLAGPTSAGSTVVFGASAADPMAGLLQLTPATTFNGEVSGDLAGLAFPINGDIDVQIGALGPFPVNFAAAGDADGFCTQLQAGIRAANPAPEFANARVALHTEGAVKRAVVIPGTGAAPAPVFTVHLADPLATNTGLDAPTFATVTLTGNLGAAPNIPNGSVVTVTIGAVPARVATTVGAANTFAAIGPSLQAAIRAADPAPTFTGARVAYYSGGGENRYMVLAGVAADVVQFAAAALDATTVTELFLDAANAQANVQAYQLGVAVGGGTAQGAVIPGNDGTPPNGLDMIGDLNLKTGIYALERVDLFNILCLPRTATKSGANALSDAEAFAVISTARDYCQRRRAFFIVDTPDNINSVDDIQTWMSANEGIRHRNLALYFPRVQVPDQLDQFRLRSFGASGTIAGIYARIDGTRGVWKAPAGIEATLDNVSRMAYPLTEQQSGILNPLAINCLRSLGASGNVVWGARTLVGTDVPASEWRYAPVRRMALFLEESLFRGTTWVVFEPNDEPLWAKIRLNLNAFMMVLFRQGAFQGSKPSDAFYVKCDGQTTTQADRDLGIVNIEVGFAPLKPAEFVVIKIQQIDDLS